MIAAEYDFALLPDRSISYTIYLKKIQNQLTINFAGI
jgi:hypothetical protein